MRRRWIVAGLCVVGCQNGRGGPRVSPGGALTDAASLADGGSFDSAQSDSPVSDAATAAAPPGPTARVDTGPPPTIIACSAVPAPVPSLHPDPALCGNGVIDSFVDADGGRWAEPCDGADLGGATCAQLGFVGGVLACTPRCLFDVRGCSSCGADPRISRCLHPVTPTPPATLSLAATDSEIAVAWIEAVGSGLHFTRFNLDFTVLSDTACFGPTDDFAISLAKTDAGWLIAGTNRAGAITLLRLDTLGALQGARQMNPIPDAAYIGFLPARLAAQVGSGPLLTWVEGGLAGGSANADTAGTLHLLQLDSMGAPLGAGVTIAKVAEWAAAAVGDGFALAALVNPFTPGYAVTLFHLAPSGTLTADDSQGGPYEGSIGIALAWSGSDLRMSYTMDSGGSPATYLQRATPGGILVGNRLILDGLANAYGSYPLFAAGDDTVVMRAPDFGAVGALSLLRWTASGTPVWPEVTLARAPSIESKELLPQGGDAIAAWIDSQRLSLARISIK